MTTPATPATGSLIPVVERTEPRLPDGYTQPDDSAYTHGTYRNREDGELYALAIDEDDPLGRTHKLKNTTHFFEGDGDEFRARFDKA